MRTRRVPIAVLAAVLVAGFAACTQGDDRRAEARRSPAATAESAADRELPKAHDFSLATFNGDTFTLSEYFGELPVVLNFWAPW